MADENETVETAETAETGETPELTYEQWIETQDDGVKDMLSSHTAGLKAALERERDQRKDLAKALKEATKELETGTEARTKLEGLSAQLDELQSQQEFYEAASAAGATNLKLAWHAAKADGITDVEAVKAAYPELFKQQPAPQRSAAGAGTNGAPASANMNDFIRAAAGRQ